MMVQWWWSLDNFKLKLCVYCRFCFVKWIAWESLNSAICRYEGAGGYPAPGHGAYPAYPLGCADEGRAHSQVEFCLFKVDGWLVLINGLAAYIKIARSCHDWQMVVWLLMWRKKVLYDQLQQWPGYSHHAGVQQGSPTQHRYPYYDSRYYWPSQKNFGKFKPEHLGAGRCQKMFFLLIGISSETVTTFTLEQDKQ